MARRATGATRHDAGMTQDLSAVGWPLTTARLTIRPATPADAATVYEFRRLPEVHEWLTAAPTTAAAFGAEFSEGDRLSRTLVMERDGRIVGDLMVRIEDPWAQAEVAEQAKGTQAELGWVLDPAAAGQGLATEAVAALVDVCFGPLGLRRVVAHCFADNTASWRLMERLGMRREVHTKAESLHRSRGWLDGMSYALLADEWREQRSSAS
jgi:RimJ/RimL family protein N-acetyltransferase